MKNERDIEMRRIGKGKEKKWRPPTRWELRA